MNWLLIVVTASGGILGIGQYTAKQCQETRTAVFKAQEFNHGRRWVDDAFCVQVDTSTEPIISTSPWHGFNVVIPTAVNKE
jgi:hypothetical protein